MQRDVAVIFLLAAIGLVAGGITLWLILKFLPLIVAIVLAVFVALVLVGVLISVIGFFASAAGALYYAIVRRPSTDSGPVTLRDTKKLYKERGKFEEAR